MTRSLAVDISARSPCSRWWAGAVSIPILPGKSGALYHLSYRPKHHHGHATRGVKHPRKHAPTAVFTSPEPFRQSHPFCYALLTQSQRAAASLTVCGS